MPVVQDQSRLQVNLMELNDFEAAVQYTLSSGQYSAIVSGADGGTGNALVEVYDED